MMNILSLTKIRQSVQNEIERDDVITFLCFAVKYGTGKIGFIAMFLTNGLPTSAYHDLRNEIYSAPAILARQASVLEKLPT
jgi:hypothetical protein